MAEKPRKKQASTAAAPALPTREVYNAFLQNVQLSNVLLSSFEGQRLGWVDPEATLGFSLEQKFAGYTLLPDGFSAQVRYAVEVSQSREDHTPPERVAYTEITLEGLYSAPNPMTDGVFQVFKNTTLPLHLWPYLREMVHTVSLRMGLPSLVLPMYQIGSSPSQ